MVLLFFPSTIGKDKYCRISELLRARERLSVAKPRKRVASKSRASTGRTFPPNEDVIFIFASEASPLRLNNNHINFNTTIVNKVTFYETSTCSNFLTNNERRLKFVGGDSGRCP